MYAHQFNSPLNRPWRPIEKSVFTSDNNVVFLVVEDRSLSEDQALAGTGFEHRQCTAGPGEIADGEVPKKLIKLSAKMKSLHLKKAKAQEARIPRVFVLDRSQAFKGSPSASRHPLDCGRTLNPEGTAPSNRRNIRRCLVRYKDCLHNLSAGCCGCVA